jgi:transcriptional regulator with XRE-family HTH domain
MSAVSGNSVVTLPLPGRSGPQPLWRQIAGDAVRERRRALGLRLRDVADRAGISPQYLSEVERGRKEPSSEMLASICGALGLPLLELLRAAGQRLNGGDGILRRPVPMEMPAPTAAAPGSDRSAPAPEPALVPDSMPVPEPTTTLRPVPPLPVRPPSAPLRRVQGLLLAA